ncbi:cell wall-binding repeat-containing protein [Candidatus Poriferisodalis sp.]|uniref:cell wall-binding repeat-containing protein n=1 Tax=Candidatus Poriferisodalis sp. TaxID=3101277 RepID=UPI003B02A6AA
MAGSILLLPAEAAASDEVSQSDPSDQASQDSPPGTAINRYGGADRYATSLQVAEAVAAEAGGDAETVVVVSGRSWSDAVIAAPLAGADPVLMMPPHELRADAAQFLRRFGTSKVVVVGTESGSDAIGDEVISVLEALGVSVDKVGGRDRYATSVAAARRLGSVGDMAGLGRTAIVASGAVFADALVAGPFAARGGHPVLLTAPGELHPDVAAFLDEADVEHVVMMGGTAALGESVEESILELGVDVTRLAGATRYDTAVKASELISGRYTGAAGTACFSTDHVGLARARVPFDSFSAAPLLGRLCAPLLLTDPNKVASETAAYLDGAREARGSLHLHVFGGDAAVSRASLEDYLGADYQDSTGSSSAATSVDQCRPRGVPDVTAGFPLPDWAVRATGTLRVAVIFMDFPDAPAATSTHQEAATQLVEMERYLESVSYGKLDVEVVPLLQWLRAERPHTHYLEYIGPTTAALTDRAGEHAIALADPIMNFSEVDVVAVVFPTKYFGGGGNAVSTLSVDRNSVLHVRVNHIRRDLDPRYRFHPDWAFVAAHELAHAMGLADLYPYRANAYSLPRAPDGKEWVLARFGHMLLNAFFQADASEMVSSVDNNYSDGAVYRVTFGALEPGEMLAWSRWQLGWLDADQVQCLADPAAFDTPVTATLNPIAQPGDGVAMIAVPLNDHEIIVIESRRHVGYDRGWPYTWPRGDVGRRAGLLHPGVLVYTVDSLVVSGNLPLKIAGGTGNGVFVDFPVLTEGQSVNVRGYTIEVTEASSAIGAVIVKKD